jgi:DNA topoisomerase-2
MSSIQDTLTASADSLATSFPPAPVVLKKITKPKVTKEDAAISETYQKKTDKQHVLDNPDTYTGSMDVTEYDTYVYDDASSTILRKNLNIIPGLYKIFDESIVNSRDHQVRMQAKAKADTDASAAESKEEKVYPVTQISVSISDDGTITMSNDGNGIDIVEHPEHKLWIPEMIFGHLRTSTNYNKQEKKIVGGKNGFGVKLVFIWSTWGKVETVDHVRGLKYIQEFSDNLNTIHKLQNVQQNHTQPSRSNQTTNVSALKSSAQI